MALSGMYPSLDLTKSVRALRVGDPLAHGEAGVGIKMRPLWWAGQALSPWACQLRTRTGLLIEAVRARVGVRPSAAV